MYKFLPAKLTISLFRRANLQQKQFSHSIQKRCASTRIQSFLRMPSHLLVPSKASLIAVKPSDVSSQALTSAARQAEGSLTTGPLLMPSARVLLRQPLLSCRRQPESSACVLIQSSPLNSWYLQRALCILCWCSPPGSLLWSPEERETAYHPAEEGQPLLPEPACSQ